MQIITLCASEINRFTLKNLTNLPYMVYNITIYVQGVIFVAKTVKEYGNDSITELKGPDRFDCALQLSLVPMALMVVLIQYSKLFPTLSTKQEKATVKKSS